MKKILQLIYYFFANITNSVKIVKLDDKMLELDKKILELDKKTENITRLIKEQDEVYSPKYIYAKYNIGLRVIDKRSIEGWKYNNPLDKQDYSDIKIIIGYHRPAFLFQHKALLPVHCGRDCATRTLTSNAGIVNNNEYAVKWLNKYCIGDNTGDNISYMNWDISVQTGYYWAWKHYDEIGNPDYIGGFHYRKLFPYFVIDEYLNYDMVIPEKLWRNSKFSDLPFFFDEKVEELLNCFCDVIAKVFPDLKDEIREYYFKEQKVMYYDEMFIFKKEIFFEYCEFVFPVLTELYNTKLPVEKNAKSNGDKRILVLLAERLFSFFLWKKTQDKSLKVLETKIMFYDTKN
ncbi:MAG: hypothetical protein Ta2D_04480 [Rickettsiales bacterium]|nr:MAG: hypothetical protein Ta2D_04480 [Rickettsiales bacterium]